VLVGSIFWLDDIRADPILLWIKLGLAINWSNELPLKTQEMLVRTQDTFQLVTVAVGAEQHQVSHF